MKFSYAETTKDLQTRIDIHARYGSKDVDKWMLDLLQPVQGMRILDVGCGAGKQLRAFYDYLGGEAELVGGDVNEELLGQARKLGSDVGAGFELIPLDFNRRFPFLDEEFDLVSCCFAIYYAENVAHTVREMHRLLKSGGQLFTTGPMPSNKALFYDIIGEATGVEIPPMPGSSRYSSEILDAIKAQFSKCRLEIFENPLVFGELQPFLDYTRASLSEDRKLWAQLFRNAGTYNEVMDKIKKVADKRLQSAGNLIMTKVVGGIIAEK
jgi:ubiquinone/menaquinone biosynthesis C-methylase UbiE